MEFINTLEKFTNDRKNEALYIFLPAGTLALIWALLAFRFSNNSYFIELGITLSLVAVLFLGYGSIFGHIKFQNKHETPSKNYQQDKVKTLNQQIDRMTEYNRYTKQNIYTASFILVISLILILFVHIKWLSGVATGLILLSFVTLMVEDGFSKEKSKKHVLALNTNLTSITNK